MSSTRPGTKDGETIIVLNSTEFELNQISVVSLPL
jgi:hypothetical protein